MYESMIWPSFKLYLGTYIIDVYGIKPWPAIRLTAYKKRGFWVIFPNYHPIKRKKWLEFPGAEKQMNSPLPGQKTPRTRRRRERKEIRD